MYDWIYSPDGSNLEALQDSVVSLGGRGGRGPGPGPGPGGIGPGPGPGRTIPLVTQRDPFPPLLSS